MVAQEEARRRKKQSGRRVRLEEEGKRRESRDNGLKPTWRAPVQGFQGFFFFFFQKSKFYPILYLNSCLTLGLKFYYKFTLKHVRFDHN